MLEKIQITNYRSIAHATVELRPLTLLVGANGTGKSNFLRLLLELGVAPTGRSIALAKHYNRLEEGTRIELATTRGEHAAFTDGGPFFKPSSIKSVRVFSLNPEKVGSAEQLVERPEVLPDGTGAIQVLDSLKTGDREDLFNKIENTFREFVPEIEKLSFVPGSQVKTLQVRERHINRLVPVSNLSEGTRLVLSLLAIVFQERKPSIICFEDLDRGIHPRLFGQVIELCRALVRDQDEFQFIATTHNPYLVDEFVDDEESVLIVEKIDGNTTFTKLSEKLRGLEGEEDTLGGKWYSGLVGGVPARAARHAIKNPNGH